MTLHDTNHGYTREEILAATARPVPAIVKTASLVLAAIGLLVFVIGLFVAPDRAWRALHFNWLFFTFLSSGGIMFVASQRIVTARWSRPVIRFMEGYVAFLPAAFVILLAEVLLGRRHIFAWAIARPTVTEKAQWLDPGFFTLRVLGIFLVWTLLSLWFVYTSVRLDVILSPEAGAPWARGLRARMRRALREERREIHSTHSLQGKLAVVMALLFAYGFSVLSWDLSMSIDLHFQSTLFGWWEFMGGWLCGLMLLALLTLWWRRHLDAYDLIGENHFHDIGKLCFAFTAFWGYLTFGQYLVIWYGNMAEETHYFRRALIQPWKPIGLAVVWFAFVLPFFGLMSKYAKLYKPTLVLFSAVSLLGMWLCRYLEVYSPLYGVPNGLPFGLWELGLTLGYVGLWGLCYASFMDAFPRMRVTLMTSPFRDEIQVPVDPKTMEPLPAHE